MDENPPSLVKSMIAGGIGGVIADASLHSIDTLKTRMQGQLTSKSTKYTGLVPSLQIIIKEEGIRGLYGGFTASMLGTVSATTMYFGIYEAIKRNLMDSGLTPTVAYFVSGGLADVGASVFYVPTEVIKTRLQLQGRYNNPHSLSAHNYKNTFHAFKSIHQSRGIIGLYSGWGATLLRDVPFSAIQFTIYETIRKYLANGEKSNLSFGQDMLAGATAGAVAGGITTPLDVIKTYLQTQKKKSKSAVFLNTSDLDVKVKLEGKSYSGVKSALKGIYQQSGVRGLYSGVFIRMGWTGSQSMIMFFLYEHCLTLLNKI